MNNLMVCVDASLIVRLLTSNNPESAYDQKWNEWRASNYTIVAPTLIHYEISNALYRYSRAGLLRQEEAEKLLNVALNLGIRFYGDAELHRQAFTIAQFYNLPAAYDAHYLALAERLNIELSTADRRLFNAVQPSLSWVKLIS